MVYTAYKNGDDWGTVSMALFYRQYHYLVKGSTAGWLRDRFSSTPGYAKISPVHMKRVQWAGICWAVGRIELGFIDFSLTYWIALRVIKHAWHGWLVVYLPAWKILVSWDGYSQYMELYDRIMAAKK